jgi:hypothetical protein
MSHILFSRSGLYFGYPIAFHTKFLVVPFHSILVRCIYNAKGFVLFFVVKDIPVYNAEFILWSILGLALAALQSHFPSHERQDM